MVWTADNSLNSLQNVLFACTHNSIRSPIAAALGNQLFGNAIQFASVGVTANDVSPFAIAIMDEIGLDVASHQSRVFSDLDNEPCDLIISLTPEAQHHAVELTRAGTCEAIYWPTLDPSLAHGSRTTILDSFREVRDSLRNNIEAYFGQAPAAAQ